MQNNNYYMTTLQTGCRICT